MTKLTCDITKDLIPSYLENLCSEDSRQAVEDHLQTCEKCRSCQVPAGVGMYWLLSNVLTMVQSLFLHKKFDPSEAIAAAKAAEEAEKGQLNYMKKVKRHFATKNALGVALLFVLSLTILFLYSSVSPGQEASLYCILFPVLTLGVFLLLSNYRAKPPRSRLRTAAIVLSALGMLYSIFLGTMEELTITTFTGFWGMKMTSVGPFLNFQFLLIVFLELAVFAGCVWSSIKNEHSFGFLPILNLACCTLSMSCRSLLYYMDSSETAAAKIHQIRIQVCLVTAGTAAAALILEVIRTKYRKKKETA